MDFRHLHSSLTHMAVDGMACWMTIFLKSGRSFPDRTSQADEICDKNRSSRTAIARERMGRRCANSQGAAPQVLRCSFHSSTYVRRKLLCCCSILGKSFSTCCFALVLFGENTFSAGGGIPCLVKLVLESVDVSMDVWVVDALSIHHCQRARPTRPGPVWSRDLLETRVLTENRPSSESSAMRRVSQQGGTRLNVTCNHQTDIL